MKSTRKIAVNKIASGTYRVSSSHGRSATTGRFVTSRGAAQTQVPRPRSAT